MHEVKPWVRPDCYIGAEWYGFHSAGFGQSRDSDTLEQSNFACASRELLALNSDTPDGEECTVRIVRENHWAVGWVEWIAIHESNTLALEAARKLCERANDYPVLDETQYSQLEWDKANSYWDSLPIKWRLRDYITPTGLPCFAARHDLSTIMHQYNADSLWESVTRD